MPESRALKTVTAAIRLTPEEKARWEEYCKAHDVTLTQALRGGFKLYMRELEEQAAELRKRGVPGDLV